MSDAWASVEREPTVSDIERRQYRRLPIRLPLECFPAGETREHALRCVTSNISTGGLFFEADLVNGSGPPEVNSMLTVELTVPPGEGHFPYEGRVSSVAEVLRCERLPADRPRIGVAARFREPLKLAF